MEPIFPKWTNKLPFLLCILLPLALGLIIFLLWYYLSPKYLAVGYQPAQPVLFSHKLHAGQLGLDCRYCHSTVEKTAFAALPSSSTCMGCHNKVLANSPLLKIVRDSYTNKRAIPWVHIYSLPRYTHFNHNNHLKAGVGCVSCHGRVDTMEQVYQTTPMSMGWCLECHRNPLTKLRPKTELTNMIYDPQAASYNPAIDLKNRQIQPPEACSSCHY